MNPEKNHTPAPPIATEPVEKEHPHLDIADPTKWQMKVRLHIEKLNSQESDQWLDGIRLISTMAGRIVRDIANDRASRRCVVCGKPFKNGGRPEAEGSYLDADRERVKVYACDQSEYPKLLEYVHMKEEAVEAAERRAEKAAQKAAKDARSASYRSEERA